MQCAVISHDHCSGHDCCTARTICPTKALVQFDRGENAVVDTSICRGCGICIAACPNGAISIRQC